MKTSKAYFEKFKAEFLRWRDVFGLTQYRIDFILKEMKDDYACIQIWEKEKIATVMLTTVIKNKQLDSGPEAHAKHEAIHLLIHRLGWLGGSRYITDDELDEEAEAIVTRLEKVL